MRTARLLTSTLLAGAAALGPAGALAYADSRPDGSLELWPTSASPGATVTANTTACGPSGHATGDANTVGAGDFPLAASTHKEVLAGQFKVASHTKPGSFRISVRCDGGRTVEAQLKVTGGDGDHRDSDTSWQWKDQPDRDKSWEWKDQQGRDKPWEGNDPHGHVKTGVGGSVRPDTTEIAVGAAVIAAAAVGGTWLLRRRASGTQGRG
ncbi:hypothetical protein [Streptomyces sp. NBC_00083]|uniref:hypothetical protein n=1 Tax=Streptomyces sp. NBC_00083 TaxID=2975647 RepID=UPI00224FEB96|nr:hypothetical protein [Streptomyces sp. NBC_00083]MCX5382622.1 hypothetical protein [Streptomyces sp. NBC_00083]